MAEGSIEPIGQLAPLEFRICFLIRIENLTIIIPRKSKKIGIMKSEHLKF